MDLSGPFLHSHVGQIFTEHLQTMGHPLPGGQRKPGGTSCEAKSYIKGGEGREWSGQEEGTCKGPEKRVRSRSSVLGAQ